MQKGGLLSLIPKGGATNPNPNPPLADFWSFLFSIVFNYFDKDYLAIAR